MFNNFKRAYKVLGFLILILVAQMFIRVKADSAQWALQFNGSSNYIALGDTGVLMGGDDWPASKTIELWVRVTGSSPPVSAPTTGETIFSTDRPRLFGLSRAIYNGQDRLWAWNADSNSIDYVGIYFIPGVWTHIAIVHGAGLLSVYQDGILVGSTTSSSSFVPVPGYDGNLFVGGLSRNDSSLHFEGEMDELRFWSTSLTNETIAEWRDLPLDSTHPAFSALRTYYSMSNGSGLSLADDSPNEFTGSLLGGMSDQNWIISGVVFRSSTTATPTETGAIPPTALSTSTLTPTTTPTLTSSATSTATTSPFDSPTPTQTPTSSPMPTATSTQVRTPTPTPTSLPLNTGTPTATAPVSGNLVEISHYDTPGNAYDIAIAGQYAYIADTGSGMRIINISNPFQPFEVSYYKSRYQSAGVFVQGNYAYLADSRLGLQIIDISNPTAPFLTGSSDTPGYCWDVTVAGDLAFVVDRYGGLRIVDVTDKYHPFEISSISTTDEALDVTISGQYAYVAEYGAGMLVVDIADPTNPRIIANLDTQRNYGIRIDGSLAYLADGGNGLIVVDISNPSNPTSIGWKDTPGWARSLRKVGTLVYLADWTNDLLVIDVTNPAHPVILVDTDLPGSSRDVDLSNGYVFVVADTDGMRVLQWR